MDYYTPTINDTFNAMVDSVNLIEQLVNDNVRSMEIYDTLDRNYRHLEFMLAQDNVINDGRSLQGFIDAVALGRNFTGFV